MTTTRRDSAPSTRLLPKPRRGRIALMTTMCFSVMIVAGGLLAIGGSPQLAPSASGQTTIDGNSLQGDYCVSAHDCWSVGWVYTGGVTCVNCTTTGNACVPLVENWNGSP